MSEAKIRYDWPIIIVLVTALVLAPLGLYVGGYFWLATSAVDDPFEDNHTVRFYRHQWTARLFYPAARVESLLRRRNVEVQRSTFADLEFDEHRWTHR